MEDRSQLADRILDQVADAVIYANRSGEIIRWMPGRVTVEGNVVGRIGEDDVGLLVVHQDCVCRAIECTAADNTMTADPSSRS